MFGGSALAFNDINDTAFPDADVSFVATPVTSAVNQVELTWKHAGNPGYSIHVDRIEFHDHQALIYYSLHEPDPGKMYIQVLSNVKTSTFVDAAYEHLSLIRHRPKNKSNLE
jgi:hypothetical protein